MLAPLTEEGWVAFVSGEAEKIKSEFDYSLRDFGVKLNIDQSVKDVLRRVAVLPNMGPRSYFERATEMTGKLLTSVAIRISQLPAGRAA